MTTDFILVHTTFPDRDAALAIAETPAKEGLAVCVSIDSRGSK